MIRLLNYIQHFELVNVRMPVFTFSIYIWKVFTLFGNLIEVAEYPTHPRFQ